MVTIDVAAGLIFRTGKLLIAQRHRDVHLGGLWEFPGGKREPDESFEQCLARELREELGIEVVVGELVESLTHQYPEKTVRLQFYLSLYPGGAAATRLPRTQAGYGCGIERLRFPAADARLLEKLQTSPPVWRED